ncbi:hypothetical protein OHC33_010066 [Knufia fluminis]|uniref:Major facilitator superfamily (MFS) profile domain-containing protein n=1 Tax=Knufia fluminis TaxID=191047 RepID=A0AAN8I3U9_9EURO|nr:hypothetical protein OHC33_010066 [Knufia fluminis]
MSAMPSKDEQDNEHEKATDLEAGGSDIQTPTASDGDSTQDTNTEGTEHVLSGLKLATVVAALMLTILCVALDNTIIATATPKITDTFGTIDDISWYGTAYFLFTCAFQLVYSKFYIFFDVKWVFLSALSLFEVGSIICAVSNTSNTFIAGRAVAGLGAAGLFSGATAIVVLVAPLATRPVINGMIGAMFGVCSILGPLIGGILAEKSTWRWCFWINLPLGAIAAAGIIFFVKLKGRLRPLEGTPFQKVRQFDPPGNLIFVGAVLSLLFALHWGGDAFAYSSPRIIALFTLFGFFTIAFIVVEVFQSDEHTIVPARVIKCRSVAFGAIFALCVGGTIFLIVYHLSLWFQVVRGASPIMSAVKSLPTILGQLFATIFAGILTKKLGHYIPFVWASAILMPIGCGLFTTFKYDMSTAKWAAYLVILGLGLGFGFQQPQVACQAALPTADIPTGSALVFSCQFLGGTIFLAVAQHRFSSTLRREAMELQIPGLSADKVVNMGATQLRAIIPPDALQDFLVRYNEAIVGAFTVALIVSCVSVIGAVGMEWLSVKEEVPASEKSDG